MARTRVALIVALALALVAASCSDDSGDEDSTSSTTGSADAESQESDGSGWTVLQYQIADTDLEPFLMDDIDEMGEVGSNENLTIRALVDRAADHGDDDVLDLGSWVGGKLIEVGAGEGEVVEDIGDVNTGDPEVLREFIAEGIEASPAEHYALVLSDHGASWPGVGGDESADHDSLSLQEIHDAIEAGLDDAGVEKLDLLGFDACLMATYEVASTLAPLADRLVASAELEPGHGWDYNALQVVADDPDATVDDLGTAIIDGYLAQAVDSGTEANVTLSMIDLTQMPLVDEAMATFTGAVVDRGAAVAPQIGRARPDALAYGRSPDPSQDLFMADLGDLVARIGIEALDVSDQADALLRAINDAVVHKIAGPGAEAFSGLSIYFPPADFLDEEYQTAVDVSGGWMDFLTSFYTAGEALPEDEQAELIEEVDGPQIAIDEEGLSILASFDPAIYENLADAYISYGLVGDDGTITYFGDESATFSEEGIAEGFFDLTRLEITDGIDTAIAYVSLTSEEDEDGFTIDIPMAYYEPDENEEYVDVLLELVIDGDGTVTQETFYVYSEEDGTYGELTADPEGIVVPDVLTVGPDGEEIWTPTSDVGLFADIPELLYDFVKLESGTQLLIELSVEDFAGNVDTVSQVVELP